MADLVHIPLGRRDYASTLTVQRQLVRAVQADRDRAFVVSVEHEPPVITLGRRGAESDVLAGAETLAREGISIEQITRGGQTTYHGPGQLVVYPIWALHRSRRSLHGHVHRMQRAVVRTCEQFSIPARLDEEAVGVFVDDRKIAAFGVAADRWVCFHGLALNVSTRLSHFEYLIPCGQVGAAVTSMSRETDAELTVAQVRPALLAELARLNGFSHIVVHDELELQHGLD
jgi:lipoyl(octanoyl) transferase